MTEFEKVVAKNKSELNARYGLEQQKRVGRPCSVGTGKKVSVYLPIKTLDILDRITKEWAGNRSDIIQEAIARYAADLDAVIEEGNRNG